ncbi:hypothetical protein BU16DRAFT_10992 [Lophium mytilinum]|uniref:Uncharacterized protein n=1 Tax=Lophium mytilinum TaxID=390894 RepID=A0A6A6RDM5_9PEZI|nr:hypothetical protein BU16DRAFT_10992 [Lophium mytilinum]
MNIPANIRILASRGLAMTVKGRPMDRHLHPNCFNACQPICRTFFTSISHHLPNLNKSESRAPRPCPSSKWQPKKSRNGTYDTSSSCLQKQRMLPPDGSTQHCPDCGRLFNDCPKRSNATPDALFRALFDADRDAWLCRSCANLFHRRCVKYVLANPAEASIEFVQHLRRREKLKQTPKPPRPTICEAESCSNSLEGRAYFRPHVGPSGLWFCRRCSEKPDHRAAKYWSAWKGLSLRCIDTCRNTPEKVAVWRKNHRGDLL